MGFFQNLAWATSICIDAIRRQGLAKTLRMWTTQEPEGSCRTIQTNRRCWENCMEKMGENGWHTKIVWGDLVWGFMGCFIKWKHTQQKMHIRIREVPRNYHRCVDCLIVWFPPKKNRCFLKQTKSLMNMVRWWFSPLWLKCFRDFKLLKVQLVEKKSWSEVLYTVIVVGHKYLKALSI